MQIKLAGPMAKKTTDDLKVVRAELARQLAVEAYALTRSVNHRSLKRLGALSEAIYALDDLIDAGVSEP